MADPADSPALPAPLALEAVTVRYGPLTAVDTLSLTVRPGEIYGLLGSNGAGKSSTIRCIVGLQRPASGSIRVLGADPAADPLRAKALVGYIPEMTLLFDALTPREFLEFVASVRRLSSETVTRRLGAYARAFGLDGEFEQPLATLSNGTRQKVLILAALLHQPPLLVLDEPLNNLDPRTVRIVKELLGAYVADGRRGVLFSTHTMEVAQQLCHRVGILDGGRLRGEGSLAQLRSAIARGEADLEEIFLKLTRSEAAVTEAVRALSEA